MENSHKRFNYFDYSAPVESLIVGNFEQVITRKEKGWRSSTYYKSEGNKYVLKQHFKVDGLHCLNFQLHQGNFMWKLDLDDAYFSVHLGKDSRKLICF